MEKASHGHSASGSARQLTIALCLTGGFLLAEVAGAIIFKSLALLSDAAHMFTDASALAVALAAIRIGQRPADDVRTYGYRRFEILAAAFNALLLFAVAGYILFEGVQRLRNPEPVQSTGMLVVAGIGLIVNLVAMRILASGKDASLNIKGAYLEVWADLLGSAGVIVGAVVIMLTGWLWVDPVIAIIIGLWVLPRTWTLLKDTTRILLEGVPEGITLAEIRSAIEQIPGASAVHDLHVWSVTSDEVSASAHIVIAGEKEPEEVRLAAAAVLKERFNIGHVTLQAERVSCRPEDGAHA
ncbi:cation transporter [Sphingomonas parva]|uniref:Cation transporter n=1 Tax=Sphingomonas parva TaxID=2555898 RepID=A0A4Y8ZWP8_9SPHN|nr:cation diffusion facilitator family transporter [Sphingomonas parva]TFI59792.1 cation transporter [Sphingomonas parva]